MKIDLHNHTSPASSCSIITPEDLLAEAKAAGLDGIGITDHDSFAGLEAVRRIGRRLGLAVFVGIECSTDGGHVLAFGVRPPYLAEFGPQPLDEVIDWIHSQGGVAVIAHPFRNDGVSPGAGLARMDGMFDAIEVVNAHNRIGENEPAIAIQQRLGLPAVAGSDAHGPDTVGKAYTIFDEPVDDETALADAIRRGACRIAYEADVVAL